ncbi:hypothetical protein D3C81_1427970 [compost metagenome]
MLHRQQAQIDIVAFDDYFVARRILDHLRRHCHDLFEDRQLRPGVLEAFRRLGLLEEGQQFADFAQLADRLGTHAHGYPLRGTEQVAEHRNVEAGRFFEQQGRAFGAQGAVADFGHFQDWRDRHLDALEFAALFQATDKVAQIAILHAKASYWLP